MIEVSKLNLSIIIIILIIVYIILLIIMSKKQYFGGSDIPTEIIEHYNVLSEISADIESDNYPHNDDYQKLLESKIGNYLNDYNNHSVDPFPAMLEYLKENIKFRRRCVIVSINKGKLTTLIPNSKAKIWGRDGVDNRIYTFIRMLKDLDKWCSDNNLKLPKSRFVIYVADTYAWEEGAKDFPWLVMAKPKNRSGILIPDDSFITHGESGTVASTDNWQWDDMIEKSKKLETKNKSKILFFKGANTGTYKFGTRQFLSKTQWDLPIKIDLKGKRESIFEWNKYYGLLNLPGNQPWSYRLKYLFLLKKPVVNVDVLLRYDLENNDDCLERWIQFFDPLFVPKEDFIQVRQVYYDNPNLKEFGKLKMKSLKKVAKDVSKAYTCIDKIGDMPERTYEKITKLSSSRILQYLYSTIVQYSKKFNK